MTKEDTVSTYKTEQQPEPCTPIREGEPGMSQMQNSGVNPELPSGNFGSNNGQRKVLHGSTALDGGAAEKHEGCTRTCGSGHGHPDCAAAARSASLPGAETRLKLSHKTRACS